MKSELMYSFGAILCVFSDFLAAISVEPTEDVIEDFRSEKAQRADL
jgi:hypothetical protein